MTSAPDLWDGLELRLKSFAWRKLRGHGVAIVNVRLVMQDGVLLGWADPDATCYEPVGNGAEGRLLAALAGGISIDSKERE